MSNNQTHTETAPFSVERGIEIGETNLAKHLDFCKKRPKFTTSHYVEDGLLYVLINDTPKTAPRKFRYIPYCEFQEQQTFVTLNGDKVTLNAETNKVTSVIFTKKTKDEFKSIKNTFDIASDHRDAGKLELYRHYEDEAVRNVANHAKQLNLDYDLVIDLIFDFTGTIDSCPFMTYEV
jgi:hypothetical protein